MFFERGVVKMLVMKPPMGWNSWNTFMSRIDEKTIKEIADAMLSQGLADAGYEYLIIDDSWSERERDSEGNLKVNFTKFPNGMKACLLYTSQDLGKHGKLIVGYIFDFTAFISLGGRLCNIQGFGYFSQGYI